MNIHPSVAESTAGFVPTSWVPHGWTFICIANIPPVNDLLCHLSLLSQQGRVLCLHQVSVTAFQSCHWEQTEGGQEKPHLSAAAGPGHYPDPSLSPSSFCPRAWQGILQLSQLSQCGCHWSEDGYHRSWIISAVSKQQPSGLKNQPTKQPTSLTLFLHDANWQS